MTYDDPITFITRYFSDKYLLIIHELNHLLNVIVYLLNIQFINFYFTRFAFNSVIVIWKYCM